MPAAHAILFFLATFLALWGATLIIRGIIGRRTGERRCPECRAPMHAVEGLTCPACDFTAQRPADLNAPRPSPVMIIAGALAIAAGAGVACSGAYVYQWSRAHDPDLVLTLWNSAATAVVLFWSLVLLWAIRGERSRGRRRCFRCLYDMRGIDPPICPECGWKPQSTRDLYRPRRRKRWAAAAILGILSSSLLWAYPRYQRGGIPAIIPSTVLIAGLEWIPQSWFEDSTSTRPQDATLMSRIQDETLWPWQQRWLRRRAARLWKRTTNFETVERLQHFYIPESPEEDGIHLRRIARGMGSRDPSVRQAAADSYFNSSWYLTRAPAGMYEEIAAEVRPCLDDPSANVRLAAAMLLARNTEFTSTVLPVLAELASADPRTRSAIPHTIAQIPDPERVYEAVLQFSTSQDPIIRAMAGRTIMYRRASSDSFDPRCLPILRTLLADAEPRVVHAAELGLLCASTYPEALALIAQRLAAGPADPSQYLRAIEGAAWSADVSSAFDAVIPYLSDPGNAPWAEPIFLTTIRAGRSIEKARPQLEALRDSGLEGARSAERILRAADDPSP